MLAEDPRVKHKTAANLQQHVVHLKALRKKIPYCATTITRSERHRQSDIRDWLKKLSDDERETIEDAARYVHSVHSQLRSRSRDAGRTDLPQAMPDEIREYLNSEFISAAQMPFQEANMAWLEKHGLDTRLTLPFSAVAFYGMSHGNGGETGDGSKRAREWLKKFPLKHRKEIIRIGKCTYKSGLKIRHRAKQAGKPMPKRSAIRMDLMEANILLERMREMIVTEQKRTLMDDFKEVLILEDMLPEERDAITLLQHQLQMAGVPADYIEFSAKEIADASNDARGEIISGGSDSLARFFYKMLPDARMLLLKAARALTNMRKMAKGKKHRLHKRNDSFAFANPSREPTWRQIFGKYEDQDTPDMIKRLNAYHVNRKYDEHDNPISEFIGMGRNVKYTARVPGHHGGVVDLLMDLACRAINQSKDNIFAHGHSPEGWSWRSEPADTSNVFVFKDS